MKHLLLIFLTLFTIPCIGQIEISSHDSLAIVNIPNWSRVYEIELKNKTDTIIDFNWRLNMPDTLKQWMFIYFTDFNLDYINFTKSNCFLNRKENNLKPNPGYSQVVSLYLDVYKYIPEDIFPLLNNMSIDILTHPNCDSIFAHLPIYISNVNGINENHKKEPYIYPIPVDNKINIKDLEFNCDNFEIYNMNGEIIQKGTVFNNEINILFTTLGIYILQIQCNGQIRRIKFLK